MKLMNQNHVAVVEYVRHGCRLHNKSAECRFKNSRVGVLCPALVSCDVPLVFITREKREKRAKYF